MTAHTEHVYSTPTGRVVYKRISEGRMYVVGWARNLTVNDSAVPTSIVTGPFIHISMPANREKHLNLEVHVDIQTALKLARDIDIEVERLRAAGTIDRLNQLTR